jgi:hypothetical protein
MIQDIMPLFSLFISCFSLRTDVCRTFLLVLATWRRNFSVDRLHDQQRLTFDNSHLFRQMTNAWAKIADGTVSDHFSICRRFQKLIEIQNRENTMFRKSTGSALPTFRLKVACVVMGDK